MRVRVRVRMRGRAPAPAPRVVPLVVPRAPRGRRVRRVPGWERWVLLALPPLALLARGALASHPRPPPAVLHHHHLLWCP